MPDSFDYTTGTNSENVRLLQALIDDAPEYTEETNSRNANILKSIINNTEYTDAPQSEIEELLLRLKAKIGGEIEVDELTVTENGTYDAGVNKAYNPVNVELPLSSKTITENGTYTASDDNLAGFNEVTVAVEGYAKKSIANTPTAIATFNASALPMPSLSVGIEAVQAGNGDPSPTNVRPISGWSAVNVYDSGKNLCQDTTAYACRINLSYPYILSMTPVTSPFNTSTTFSGVGFIAPVKKGTTYALSSDATGVSDTFMYGIYEKIEDMMNINKCLYKNNTSSSFTSNYDGYVLFMRYNDSQGTSVSWSYAQMELGTAPSTYEPFSGTTYTTQLKDGQGNPLTCYGGQLVNENGVQRLDNTYVYVDLGSPTWGYTNGRFYYNPTNAKVYAQTEVANMLCSQYPIIQYLSQADNSISSYAGYIYVRADSYSGDITAFKTAMNGVQLVYELATPQQIPQDNLPIATQEGTNNLWADSGDVQSGEYLEAL